MTKITMPRPMPLFTTTAREMDEVQNRLRRFFNEAFPAFPGDALPMTEPLGWIPAVEIVENDLRSALERGLAEAPTEEKRTVKCGACAAEFTLGADRHAGTCPFCGSSAVTDTGASRRIKPAAMLPFAIGRNPSCFMSIA